MTLWERAKRVFSSRASQALDRLEDPAASLEEAYRRQREVLARVQNSVVDVLTAEKRVALDLPALERSEARYREDARVALERGDDAAARTALGRAVGARYGHEALERQIADLRVQRESLEATAERLRSRVEAFRVQKIGMQAQMTSARAASVAHEAMAGVSDDARETQAMIERARESMLGLRARSEALAQLGGQGTLDPVGASGDEAADARVREAAIARDVEQELTALRCATTPLPPGNA